MSPTPNKGVSFQRSGFRRVGSLRRAVEAVDVFTSGPHGAQVNSFYTGFPYHSLVNHSLVSAPCFNTSEQRSGGQRSRGIRLQQCIGEHNSITYAQNVYGIYTQRTYTPCAGLS